MGNASDKLSSRDLEYLQTRTKLDKKRLLQEYREFKKSFPDGYITKDKFMELTKNFLGPEKTNDPEYVSRLFNGFDTDGSGRIDFQEWMLAIAISTSGKPEEKLEYCFRSFDVDNSGYLDRKEMLYVVSLIFQRNPGIERKVSPEINSPEKVVSKIFAMVDANGDDRITAEELIEFMHKDPKTFQYLGLNLMFLT